MLQRGGKQPYAVRLAVNGSELRHQELFHIDWVREEGGRAFAGDGSALREHFAFGAAGNYVVVAMGHGRWAFYGHLQPASIVVRAGQQVNAGQTLARLGNSGNSDAPHLHFEIMDGPTLQASSGLPFRFRRFTGEGTLTNFLPFLLEGHRAVIKLQLRGPHRNELPLNDEVIGFR
jgi:murein DD-endopeptidase MepM/ murein hydrolase activator NlpD